MPINIDLKQNHLFLKLVPDINELLTPLKRFGITTFSFSRLFHNNTQIYLSNCGGWLEDYYNKKLYGGFINANPSDYQTGVLPWPVDSDLEVFKLARERYNSDNGITLIRTHPEYTDFYFFSGEVESTFLSTFYYNHTNLLETFTLYFEDRASKILAKANEHKIKIAHPTNVESITTTLKNTTTDELVAAAIKDMRLKKYQLKLKGFEHIKLSAREIECILELSKGSSAKQIAREYDLSFRTVERYFDNIKDKLACNTRKEILIIAEKEGLTRIASD